MEFMVDQIKAVMLGHAVADALGVPVEFSTRARLDADPVKDMRGFGQYNMPAGSFSDDTSMAIAALDVLSLGSVDWGAIMQSFVKWLKEAEYTPTGKVFDVGRTCADAIFKYYLAAKERGAQVDFDPAATALSCGLDSERSNGNGSLMRIHPFVLYAKAKGLDEDTWIPMIEDASRLTHAHERSRVGCLVYAFVLMALLDVPEKQSVVRALAHAKDALQAYGELAHYARLFAPEFPDTTRDGIKSSGYVVDTLEAAIWCLLTTDSFADCVLKAVNLGEDTDTVAAIAGGLAGALYGYGAIPTAWLDTLIRREDLEGMCNLAALGWM